MAPGYFWSAQHIPHGSGPQQVPDAAFIAHARTDLPRALAELDKADARIAELERQLAQSDAVISTLDVRRLVFAHPIDSPISPHWASVSEAIERHRARLGAKTREEEAP